MTPANLRPAASLYASARPFAPLLFFPAGAAYCMIYDLTIGGGLIPFSELLNWSLLTLSPWVAGALIFERSVRPGDTRQRSEEHTSELQSRENLVCRLLLEKKNHKTRA